MASLPSQHPSLAIHMTDRATTPLISSAVSSASSISHSPSQQRQSHHPKQRKRQHPAFSTSPPSSATPSPSSTPPSAGANPDAASDSDDEDDEDDEPPISPASKQAKALTTLSATALLSYDAAKRLGRGAPLRTMVEYPDAGPVVLHSYMCPMGLALGVPGRRNGSSSASLHTSAGAVGSAGGSVSGGDDDDGGGGGGIDMARAEGGVSARDGDHRRRPTANRRTPTGPLSFGLDPVGGGDEGGGTGTDMEGIDPSDPPMLTSTVVTPRAEDLREARRATARLEKVARVFQAEWVSTGRR